MVAEEEATLGLPCCSQCGRRWGLAAEAVKKRLLKVELGYVDGFTSINDRTEESVLFKRFVSFLFVGFIIVCISRRVGRLGSLAAAKRKVQMRGISTNDGGPSSWFDEKQSRKIEAT